MVGRQTATRVWVASVAGVEEIRAFVLVVGVSAGDDDGIGSLALGAVNAALKRTVNTCGSEFGAIGELIPDAYSVRRSEKLGHAAPFALNLAGSLQKRAVMAPPERGLHFATPVRDVGVTTPTNTEDAMRRSKNHPDDWSKYVPRVPEDFPEDAQSAWPDLSAWPSRGGVRELLKTTKSDPAVRLSVLAGLRHFAHSDTQSIWSFVSIWLAVMIALLAIPMPDIAILVTSIVVFGVGLWFVSYTANRTIAIGQRSVRARIWLAAIEDALASSRR